MPKSEELKKLYDIEKQKEPITQELEKNVTILEQQLNDYDELDLLEIKSRVIQIILKNAKSTVRQTKLNLRNII